MNMQPPSCNIPVTEAILVLQSHHQSHLLKVIQVLHTHLLSHLLVYLQVLHFHLPSQFTKLLELYGHMVLWILLYHIISITIPKESPTIQLQRQPTQSRLLHTVIKALQSSDGNLLSLHQKVGMFMPLHLHHHQQFCQVTWMYPLLHLEFLL